jgi:hypothetical protein
MPSLILGQTNCAFSHFAAVYYQVLAYWLPGVVVQTCYQLMEIQAEQLLVKQAAWAMV